MTNYVIDKENSIAKVRSEAKAALMADLTGFIAAAFWTRLLFP